MPEAKVRVETPSPNLILVHDLLVNYDQNWREAIKSIKGFSDTGPLITASFSQRLWNGSESGVVEGVTIPIYWPRQSFYPSTGRQMQNEIGYGFPAVLAALALGGEDVRKTLLGMGIRSIASLCPSDEMLWRRYKAVRHVCLVLVDHYRGFILSDGYYDLETASTALIGTPQVP